MLDPLKARALHFDVCNGIRAMAMHLQSLHDDTPVPPVFFIYSHGAG